jgi:hypothetical protein
MAESDTILQLGIDAAREGNREEARNLFGLLTRQEPDNLQAWLWLAGVADGPDERRAALERVVELDPTNKMAIQGLEALGVKPAAPAVDRESAARAATIPAAAAREMTDEERYAAELDSAFDDYDTVQKVEAPPRPEPDLEMEAGAARAESERRAASRASARERSAARRGTTTPVRSVDDDDMRAAGGTSGTARWVWIGAAVVGLIFALILFNYSRRPATIVGGGAGVPSPVAEATTPTGEGGAITTNITATEELPTTEPLTNTTPLSSTATLQPPTAPANPSAADLSKAKPQPVDIGTQLEANGWGYTYPNSTYAAILGPQTGNFTAKGNYVVVLVHVANNSGKDQPLPANFFVLKDEQGRVYNALPQVSSAYVQPGVNADIGMEDTVPANGVSTSVPLIFDVQHGATNLVLFASGKTDQGWKVLDSIP